MEDPEMAIETDHRKRFQKILLLAMQGIEPWTFALLARRSNQLSYTAMCREQCLLSIFIYQNASLNWGRSFFSEFCHES